MNSLSRKKWAVNLALSGLSILVSLGAVEFLLRSISPGNAFSSEFPLYPSRRRIIQVTYKGLSHTIVNSTNKWGLRGDDPPADWQQAYTLIAVGGSTTQCYYQDDHKTWPYLLQIKLRKRDSSVWVGNAGLDGHSTRGHLLLMREVVARIQPKAVIFLVGVNDLALSLRKDPTAYDLPGDWKWKLFRHSRIGQILYTWLLILLKQVPVVQHSISANPYIPLTHPMVLPSNLRSLLPFLTQYRQNIRSLIVQCRTDRIRPIFLTQPMLYEDTPTWRKYQGFFYWIPKSQGLLSAAMYWKLMATYNQELLAVCQEEHVECYDLASAIPHREEYFLDTVHFSDAGNELVAEKVGAYLESTGRI